MFITTNLLAINGDYAKVVRVVDGDTIVVKFKNGNYEKVRLIGINTPETVDPRRPVQYFGKEASKYTKSKLTNKIVYLKYDWQIRDRYGRLLAYIYLKDGTFFNAQIVKDGYAFAFTKYPFKYSKMFIEIEKIARENNRGLWGKDSPYLKEKKYYKHSIKKRKKKKNKKQTPFIIKGKFLASKKGKYFYSPDCKQARRIKTSNIIWFKTWDEALKKGYKPNRCLKK